MKILFTLNRNVHFGHDHETTEFTKSNIQPSSPVARRYLRYESVMNSLGAKCTIIFDAN